MNGFIKQIKLKKLKINKDYLEIIKAARAGGEVVKKYFGKNIKITGKTIPADFKTKADMESEEVILKILNKKFPKYNIIAEENGEKKNGSEYTFVIDPLDGTNNFVLGIPYFSIGVGLLKGSEIIFGVVYNPILDNMYFAEKGKGAYLNGKKIHVNDESNLTNSSVSVVTEYGDATNIQEKLFTELSHLKAKRCLMNWSCLLDFCLLGVGKIEGIIFSNCPLHDFIPGKLIAKEAGALVTDLDGVEEKSDKNNIFLTTNGTKIHKEILDIINK